MLDGSRNVLDASPSTYASAGLPPCTCHRVHDVTCGTDLIATDSCSAARLAYYDEQIRSMPRKLHQLINSTVRGTVHPLPFSAVAARAPSAERKESFVGCNVFFLTSTVL